MFTIVRISSSGKDMFQKESRIHYTFAIRKFPPELI